MACLANIASECIFDEIAPCADSATSVDIGATIVGGTAGSVLFVGSGPVLAQDNSNFFWDDSSNRLGLGNGAPSDTLHVTGTARFTGNMGIGIAPSTMRLLIAGSTEAESSLRLNLMATGHQVFLGASGGLGLGAVGMSTAAPFNIITNGATRAQFSALGNLDLTPGVSSSGAVTAFKLTAPANTGQTLSTEAIDFHLDLSRTNTWATGALTLQRMMLFDVNATLAFAGASVVSTVVGLHITAPPTQGSNATFTQVINVLLGADASGAAATTTIVSAAGAQYHKFQISDDTVSLTGSTQLTSTPSISSMLINKQTISFAGTIDVASTVHIVAAPSISGGGSITNSNALFVQAGKTQLGGELELDGAFNHDGSNVGFYGVAPVTRSSGWTITNDVTDRNFDANAGSVTELADVVATLIRDVAATGLIGAVA